MVRNFGWLIPVQKAHIVISECRRSRSTLSPATRSTLARASCSFGATAKCALSILLAPFPTYSRHISRLARDSQIFRFSTAKTASLFLQRKNPRKIAWTQVYRRMHKKGITEEVAKKRSRRTVKHQRGIVGADLAAIAAKRNQTAAQRSAARLAAVTKAKSDKKDKEAKKEKTKVRFGLSRLLMGDDRC